MGIAKTKGVDVSSNNGNIDLAKVKKAGYKWVMIRCGYGDNISSQDDSQFAANVKKAEKLGLPWGVYIYSYATNVKEAKSEVEHVKRLLKGKKPTLPVAFDMEDADGYKSKHGALKKSIITDICKTFLSEIKKAGYYPMLYSSLSWFGTYIDKSVYSKYDLWVAQWSKSCDYKGTNLGMWQYGGEVNYIESNSIAGVGTIDKNKVYKDYPSIIKKSGYNNWPKKKTVKAKVKKVVKKVTTKKKTTTKTMTEAQLRKKVAATINGWMGATTGSAGHKEILKIYNAQNPLPVGYKVQPYDAWCAATVSATWLKLGIAKYITTECGCGRFIDNAKKKGIWVENDAYKPKVGDAVIYYWNDNGVGDCKSGADHIGIVTAVNGNTFVVTEGNTGNGIVGKRTMKVNGTYIRGFITPNYAAIAKKLPAPKTTQPVKKVTTKKSTTTVAKPTVKFRAVLKGKKLDAITNGSTKATGKAIVGLAAKPSSGTLKYKVHIKGGSWLSAVSGYDFADFKNGYAGNGNPVDRGSTIDAIKMTYSTTEKVKKKFGKYKIAYRVHLLSGGWLPWQYNVEKTKGQDGYAGIIGKTIDGIEIKLVKA